MHRYLKWSWLSFGEIPLAALGSYRSTSGAELSAEFSVSVWISTGTTEAPLPEICAPFGVLPALIEVRSFEVSVYMHAFTHFLLCCLW